MAPPSRAETDRIDAAAVAAAASITHRHLLAVVNTLLAAGGLAPGPLRVLDAGCGDGRLAGYLQEFLPRYLPGRAVEVHGFDIDDGGIQPDRYLAAAREALARRLPGVAWDQRLHLVGAGDAWPFDAGRFDVVVSNQVLEHVSDHGRFFAEHHRVLRDGGRGVHLFPLRHVIHESHLRLPLVHKLRQTDALRLAIRLLSRLGLGKWPDVSHEVGIDEFAISYADLLTHHCHYVTKSEVLRTCQAAGFRANFAHTGDFYAEKARELGGRPARLRYRPSRAHLATIHLYKYLASVTLVVEKADRYVNYWRRYAGPHQS